MPVSLINNGNVPAKGPITFRILASTDNVLSTNDTEVISLPRNVGLKPGRARVMPLTFRMPAIAAGTYFFIVQANWGGAIGDVNTANNTDASDAAVTVS